MIAENQNEGEGARERSRDRRTDRKIPINIDPNTESVLFFSLP